jgi:protoporphyrinogen oxidase
MHRLPQIAIIGAGISGLSAAKLLQEKGFKPTVFEASPTLGGLVSCKKSCGHLFHTVGGHVFNTKISRVHDWFWSHFDIKSEFVFARRNAVISLPLGFVPYPIEFNLDKLPSSLRLSAQSELEALALTPTKQKFSSLSEFLVGNFGETLAKEYFLPYNQKVWQKNLSEISISWLNNKLPMSSPSEILEMNKSGIQDSMSHNKFYYPKTGGSQFIVDRLANDLDIIKLKVNSIDKSNDKFRINNLLEDFDAIIYTGDLRVLPQLLGSNSRLLGSSFVEQHSLNDSLYSNGTTTMLCECDANPYSWVYLPSASFKPHRIIMTGNFSPSNNSEHLSTGRITCTVEASGHIPQAEMVHELKSLPFSVNPIDYNYTKSTYVIHNSDTQRLLSSVAIRLDKSGIFLLGRLAQWQYYNMDNAIDAAFDVCERVARYVK